MPTREWPPGAGPDAGRWEAAGPLGAPGLGRAPGSAGGGGRCCADPGNAGERLSWFRFGLGIPPGGGVAPVAQVGKLRPRRSRELLGARGWFVGRADGSPALPGARDAAARSKAAPDVIAGHLRGQACPGAAGPSPTPTGPGGAVAAPPGCCAAHMPREAVEPPAPVPRAARCRRAGAGVPRTELGVAGCPRRGGKA